MRVLLTTYPERTHFLAMVPLAWALRTAGHDVRVAVQPKFAPTVTQAGLTAAPVGRNSDLWQILGRYGHFLTDDPNDLGIPPPDKPPSGTRKTVSRPETPVRTWPSPSHRVRGLRAKRRP